MLLGLASVAAASALTCCSGRRRSTHSHSHRTPQSPRSSGRSPCCDRGFDPRGHVSVRRPVDVCARKRSQTGRRTRHLPTARCPDALAAARRRATRSRSRRRCRNSIATHRDRLRPPKHPRSPLPSRSRDGSALRRRLRRPVDRPLRPARAARPTDPGFASLCCGCSAVPPSCVCPAVCSTPASFAVAASAVELVVWAGVDPGSSGPASPIAAFATPCRAQKPGDGRSHERQNAQTHARGNLPARRASPSLLTSPTASAPAPKSTIEATPVPPGLQGSIRPDFTRWRDADLRNVPRLSAGHVVPPRAGERWTKHMRRNDSKRSALWGRGGGARVRYQAALAVTAAVAVAAANGNSCSRGSRTRTW